MKKLFLIGLLLPFVLVNATQSTVNRYDGSGDVLKHTKTLILNDTIPDNDTSWCTELNINLNPGEWYSIGFDIDSLTGGNSAISGEVLIRQGDESGNLQVYTSIYTLSDEIDTSLNISNLVEPMTFMQVGVANTHATDTIWCRYLGTGKTQ